MWIEGIEEQRKWEVSQLRSVDDNDLEADSAENVSNFGKVRNLFFVLNIEQDAPCISFYIRIPLLYRFII